MATPARQIAAFRQRLVGDPSLDPLSAQLVAIVGDRVQPGFLADQDQPVYPCITLYQTEGKQGVWAPRITDYGVMQIQFYSKSSQQEIWDMYELANQLLHNQKTKLSTVDICFHEVREIYADTGGWIPQDSVWQMTAKYLFRASVKE